MTSKFGIKLENRFDSFQSDEEHDNILSEKKSNKIKNSTKLKKLKKLNNNGSNSNRNNSNKIKIDKKNTENKICKNVDKIGDIANVSETLENVDQSISWFDLCEEEYNQNIQVMSRNNLLQSVSLGIVDKEITSNKSNIVSIQTESIESNKLCDVSNNNTNKTNISTDNVDDRNGNFIPARRKKPILHKSNQAMTRHPRDVVYRPAPLVKAFPISRCQQNEQKAYKIQNTQRIANGKKIFIEKATKLVNKESSDINGNWREQNNHPMSMICSKLRHTQLQ